MSESEIITKEAQVDSLNKLTKEQQSMIEGCIESLNELKGEGKITENSLRQITNVWRELDALRELFYTRLFNSLKRGDILLN